MEEHATKKIYDHYFHINISKINIRFSHLDYKYIQFPRSVTK